MPDARPNLGPDGVLYPSIRAACRKFNKSENPVYKRMRRGMTLAQAIQDAPDTDAKAVAYGGRKYPSLKALCDECGAPYTTVYTYVRKGMPLERAIAASGQDRVFDAFGTEYKSARALCRDWGISRDVLSYQLRHGKDTTEAMSAAACAKWPGTDAGPFRIIRCVRWPWFLCEDGSGIRLMLDARKIKELRAVEQNAP